MDNIIIITSRVKPELSTVKSLIFEIFVYIRLVLFHGFRAMNLPVIVMQIEQAIRLGRVQNSLNCFESRVVDRIRRQPLVFICVVRRIDIPDVISLYGSPPARIGFASGILHCGVYFQIHIAVQSIP